MRWLNTGFKVDDDFFPDDFDFEDDDDEESPSETTRVTRAATAKMKIVVSPVCLSLES